jgi:hypothetical protein
MQKKLEAEVTKPTHDTKFEVRITLENSQVENPPLTMCLKKFLEKCLNYLKKIAGSSLISDRNLKVIASGLIFRL